MLFKRSDIIVVQAESENKEKKKRRGSLLEEIGHFRQISNKIPGSHLKKRMQIHEGGRKIRCAT